ncbi:MAG: TonB-dependent receptor [Bryobacteraceae bacterium]
MKLLQGLLWALVLALASVPAAFGQAAAINGTIEGTVTDPSGALVPNVQVSVLNTETGFRRSATTNENGFYRVAVLPLGNYTVSTEIAAFAPTKRTDVVLNAGTTATVDIALGLAGTTRTIVVTDAAPVIEPGRTDIGTTVTRNSITNLPLVSRNNFNFILLQPNVSGRPNVEFGVPRMVNANGFLDRINYQLDGNNNTQSDRAGIRLTPISNTWIAEIQQVNNGFAPEYGNTVGTVFNSITKSGANDIHGEGGYIFRRTDMVARSSALSRTANKPQQQVDNVFADVGGHIIKDKLFYFGSFERVKRDLPSAVTATPANLAALGLSADLAQAIPFSQENYFALVKIDWQINDNNRLSGRWSYFRNESPYNNGGGLTLATQTYLFKDRAPTYAFQLISTLSPTAVNEFRFQSPKRFQRQTAFDASGAPPTINVSGIANFGASDQTGFEFTETTPEWTDNFTYNRANHSYKFGGTMRWILDKQIAATFARYTFPSIQAYLDAKNGVNPRSYSNYTQLFGNPSLEYTSIFSNFYVQDTWKVRKNLTLTYGLRYDIYKVPGADSAALFPASQNFNVDKNNFAPRLGIAWSPGNDQKWVFRANTGMFYDAPQTNVYQRALLNNGRPQFFNLSTGPTNSFTTPAFPTILTALPGGFNRTLADIITVSPDFRNLYSWNANVQVTRQLDSNTSLSLSYLFTKGTKLPVYLNVNTARSGKTLADGRPTFSGFIDPNFSNVSMAQSIGNSNYNGLNVTVTRRFARGFEAFGTYTWSHALDNAPEQNVIDAGALSPSDPTNLRGEYGNSLGDRRHSFTLSSVMRPYVAVSNKALGYVINNNQFSILFVARSGDVFNIGTNRNLNGDATIASSQQRPLFVGRNTVRGQNVFQMDLRYSRQFPIGERWKPEFFAEFWNLFNHTNVTGLNTTATVDVNGNITGQPTFLQTGVLDPRLAQIGLKLTF